MCFFIFMVKFFIEKFLSSGFFTTESFFCQKRTGLADYSKNSRWAKFFIPVFQV